MTPTRLLQLGALLLTLIGGMAVGTANPGLAAPVSNLAALKADAAPLTPVQLRIYRGRPLARPYVRYGYRPFVGFGIGAAIVAGAIIANRAYAPRRGYYYDTYAYDGPYYYPSDFRGDPREICARNFKSFEWDSGLYTTYGGEKRMCPYLKA